MVLSDLRHDPGLVPRRIAGRLTQRTMTLESHVDRSPRDSGIGLGGIDLHNPDPDYDNEDYEGDFPVQNELFYPRDQDIIFRGNYTENWRRLDKTYSAEDSASSAIGPINRLATRTTYRSKPVDSDTDSSDKDMDYTTFLERKMRRDEEKAAMSAASNQSVITGEPTLIRTRSLVAELSQARTTTLEPSLVKTRDEHTPVESVKIPELNRMQTTNRIANNQEERPVPSDEVQVESYDCETYAVVHKPPKQPTKKTGDVNTAATPANSFTGDCNSPDAISTSSRSSSEYNDSTLENGNGRQHRTHIYHINSSPSSSRDDEMGNRNTAIALSAKQPTKKSKTKSTVDEAGVTQIEEEHCVVITEVMDEVATRVPTPPADYRQPSVASDGSSTSNSSSTITIPSAQTALRETKDQREGRSGEDSPTTVDLLTEEIRRLEERQSNIGSREIFQLGDFNFKSLDKQQKGKNGRPATIHVV